MDVDKTSADIHMELTHLPVRTNLKAKSGSESWRFLRETSQSI